MVTPELARSIVAAVRSVRYGSVEITVHDGRVVQVERREKYRFEGQAGAAAGAAATTAAEESPPAPHRDGGGRS